MADCPSKFAPVRTWREGSMCINGNMIVENQDEVKMYAYLINQRGVISASVEAREIRMPPERALS